MDKDEEIRKGLKRFASPPEGVFPATVIAVKKNTDTITVEDADGFEFQDVRLKSAIADGDAIIKYPAEKSEVLVGKIGNDENTLFVVAFSEVESISGNIGATTFIIDKEGYQLKRDNESLKQVLNDFIDEVNKIVVVHGNTINVAATTAIKKRLNKILK